MNDKMMRKLRVTSGGVPKGTYLAKFVSVESITNDYGPGLTWKWEVLRGLHAGQSVGRITKPTPTTKNVAARFFPA